jgi:hypothetical protein
VFELDMKTELFQKNNWLSRALFVGAGLVLALGLVAGLRPQPQAFTELYFDNAQSLPTVWPARPVSFSFHIHNRQGQTISYHYQVVETTPAGARQLVKAGVVELPNDGSKDVPVTIPAPATKARTEVTVVLPDQSQSIHFWVGGTA